MDRPLLVTSAIITRGDELLLIRRAREPYEGMLAFVGGCGAFEKTSDPEEAVKLEVLADLRCEFHPTFMMKSYEEFFDEPTNTLFYQGPITGVPRPNPKYVSEYIWLPRERARDEFLAFEHNPVLEAFMRSGL